ncbi:efflux RND transporter permease subunit [Sideroxydans sp. CL21]|uniref:efflux RND transporter permease subunit n=1 Tax=Sideroxydans sp. CL21 TaxID=2600596 RepID=UPI0012AA5AFF|nr:efflux RND transporter permease subunit [Sideroxydans sp. CL21]VVC82612.1 Cobalt-zinc-cadmium resistance protein CzcA; Cation efflux system protein CusA [Sideroxydans sp. CL21]
MLWIVRIALSRPYTFIVLALLILILGPLVYVNMRTDIFPDIKVPVVSAVWAYNGLPPEDMSDRIVTYYERQLSTAVNDIEHIESQSLPGVAVVKIFFQPDVNINAAVSQVTALSQTVLKRLPPGITPPLILSYNASSVPVLQLALSSDTLLDNQLFDLANNFIRPILAQVRAAIPSPYGGKNRQVQVDLDMQALRSKGLTPQDVTNAILSQNLILPAGTEKMGEFEYNVKLNASPDVLDDLNDLPIKSLNGATILLRDVAHVRDGYSPQQNIVRVNGQHSVLTTIQKNGSASTLDIIDNVKALLPRVEAGAPPGLVLKVVGDQSVFVKSAVSGVIREGVIAAALTGLMILLFLGSWRSTLIITISIPLAILSAIIALAAFGQTLNVMTLGGLALAVGILVDDATVTIENMNWHLDQGKNVEAAIMDGAHQIVGPAFVSLLCICIVFIPMFFLEGVAKYLFVPLAEAVMFSMIASFILSRTLVPTLAKYLLRPHVQASQEEAQVSPQLRPPSKNPLIRFQHAFETVFSRIREKYRGVLTDALSNRVPFIIGFLGFVLVSFALVPWLGRNFFPAVDAGEIKLHIRAQTGTRIEETARLCDEIERQIKNEIPAGEIKNILDNIGLPVSGINLTYSNSSPIGPGDADILISLNAGHRPTAEYVKALRVHLQDDFPGVSFAFLPADIVSQILNFGMPAPINVQVIGFNRKANEEYAASIMNRMKRIPGLADLRIQQAFNQPELYVDVNRTRAREMGLTQHEVATNMLVSLSGSFQTAPNFWVNPDNKVSYPVVVQVPQPRLDTLSDLQNIPVSSSQDPVSQSQLLGTVATITRGQGEAVVSHYDVEPTIDIFGSTQERDLGNVAYDMEQVLKDTAKDVPKGSYVVMRGQVKAMNDSYSGLLFGLLGAIVLIYLLIVVNFQSWLDPFVIITALPAALAGIVWMLFVTDTTLSVPALIGSIMCMGVATANSILVVSFARERMSEGDNGITAALEAGFIRFRPVLMTALAMMIGMAPMALGLGEGGEQNAPLGRAVIGGLAFATLATLLFVPVVFSLVHKTNEHLKQDEHNAV